MPKIIHKGILRCYILKELKARPMHGYELMAKIEEKTGFWKPTCGAVYPALKEMKKAGLIRSKKQGRKIVYKLTKKGMKSIGEFDNELEALKGKFISTFSQLLNVKKESIEQVLKNHEAFIKTKSPEKKKLIKAMFRNRNLIYKATRKKKNIEKVTRFLDSMNKRLEMM
jgi:DNA-binding PadR family transcriptional regulator